jgi:hypothetical protein
MLVEISKLKQTRAILKSLVNTSSGSWEKLLPVGVKKPNLKTIDPIAPCCSLSGKLALQGYLECKFEVDRHPL